MPLRAFVLFFVVVLSFGGRAVRATDTCLDVDVGDPVQVGTEPVCVPAGRAPLCTTKEVAPTSGVRVVVVVACVP